MDAAENINFSFSFEKLDAYKEARSLVKEIYKLQSLFPKEEKYALGDQIRRAAISITSNIAEGCGRNSSKEKAHFFEIAFGSLTETFSELQIATDLGYISEENLFQIKPSFTKVAKLLSGLHKSLKVENVQPLTPKPYPLNP